MALQVSCGTDCVPLTLDHLSLQLLCAALPWTAMVSGGLVASICFPRRVKNLRVGFSIYESGISSSGLPAAYAVMVTSIIHCIIFAIRASTRQVDQLNHAMEVICTMVACVDTIAGASFIVTQGPPAILRAAFLGRWFVDVLSITSIVSVALAPSGMGKTWFTFSFISAFRLIRAMEFLQRLNMWTSKASWRSQIIFEVVRVCAYVIGLSGWVIAAEHTQIGGASEELEWDVFTSLIVTITIMTTLGNTPLPPQTIVGRLLAIGIMIWSAYLMGTIVGPAVISLLVQRNIGSGRYKANYDRFGNRVGSHLVVVGSPSGRMLLDFLLEIFHENHFEDIVDFDDHAADVVILVPSEETLVQLTAILAKKECTLFRRRVIALRGEPFNRGDLERVSLRSAAAAFVLPNLTTARVADDDSANIMRAFAIGSFAPRVRTLCLLHRAVHRPSSLSVRGPDVTFISVGAFKLSLLAKGCQTRGTLALVLNLCKSIGEKHRKNAKSWQLDYQHSIGNELYELTLSAAYDGKTFGEVCLDLQQRSGRGDVLLIGIIEHEPKTRKEEARNEIRIFPGLEYQLRCWGSNTSGIFVAPDIGSINQLGDDLLATEMSHERNRKLVDHTPRLMRHQQAEARLRATQSRHENKTTWEQIADITETDKKKTIAPLTKEEEDRSLVIKTYDSAMKRIRRELLIQGVEVPLVDVVSTSLHVAVTASAQRQETGQDLPADSQPIAPERPVSRDEATLLNKSQRNLQALEQKAWMRSRMTYIADRRVQETSFVAPGGHLLLCVVSDTTESCEVLRTTRDGFGPAIGMEYFMRPLRDSRVQGSTLRPTVVVLADALPIDWADVLESERLHYIRGDPLCLRDLERARFRSARAIAITRWQSQEGRCERVVDARALALMRLIEANNSGAAELFTVVDFCFESSCAFLPPPKVDVEPPEMTPPFSLPSVLTIGDLFLSGTAKSGAESEGASFSPAPGEENYEELPGIDYPFTPRFMTGQVFIVSVMASIAANSFYNPSLIQMLLALLHAPILLVPLPEGWERRSYADLFAWLLRHRNLLAIGLFRAAAASEAGLGKAVEANKPTHQFVFTSPPAYRTIVVKTDQILCIVPTLALVGSSADEDGVDTPIAM